MSRPGENQLTRVPALLLRRNPQLNAGVGHEQYFVGMDVELDDFMARLSLSACLLLHADVRHMTHTDNPAISSTQRDYIKELEDMKRELEQYMASVRNCCCASTVVASAS
jgi:hypothetical protein